ncbi:MAG: hypothetical protein K2R98_27600 [Gemmataceae bacterium]|nr:hypothetical protein [Gemmataceae bacterium]
MRPKHAKRMAHHALATQSHASSHAGLESTTPGLSDTDLRPAAWSADPAEPFRGSWESAWIDIGGEG